jgi:hypothetical protein
MFNMAGLNLPEFLKGQDMAGEGTVLRNATDSVEDAQEVDDAPSEEESND